jgi:DNA-binding NtrC family response regulator
LRVLEAQTVQPVGSDRPVQVDTRVVAATHRDLQRMVAAKEFRFDLFYRLAVVHVALPPVRQRLEDLPHLIATFYRRRGVDPGPIDGENLDRMRRHAWPGNVRELRNVIERMVILTPADVLDSRDVPVPPQTVEPAMVAPVPNELATLDDVERAHIRAVLAKVRGNRSAAARILGITRQTLRKKISEPSTNG